MKLVNDMAENNWNSPAQWNTPAPGDLELVRRFVNTLKVPRGMRERVDDLPALLGDSLSWRERFPGWPVATRSDVETLTLLRDDLRSMLGAPDGWIEQLNPWLARLSLTAQVHQDDRRVFVRYVSHPETGFAGRVLATVAKSVDDGTFFRLKACPDCTWVFYDTSRSKTRVWCGMYAGEKGRACGTISKVKRYRQRRKASEQP